MELSELTVFITVICTANLPGSSFNISVQHRNVDAKENNCLGLGKSPFKDLRCETLDF